MLVALPAEATKVRLAVSYFANRSGQKALDPLAKGLADMLITDLSLADDVVVVERERLNALLTEIKLQRNPYFDKTTAAKLGKGLGAAYLLTGSYLQLGKSLSIEARVLDVEQAKVVLAVREQGPTTSFFTLQRKLAQKLLKGIGAKLSLLAQKKVGARGTRSYEAFKHYARSLNARDARRPAAEKQALRAALRLDAAFLAVKERLAKLSQRVSALEKAGGLIMTPTHAEQHLHNTKLHRQAGRHAKARLSVIAGLRLDPALLDLWRELRSLPQRAPGIPKGLVLSAARRKLLGAYLAGRDLMLWGPIRDHKAVLAHQALAAVLLFDRKDSPPPFAAATTSAILYQSGQVLIGKRAGLAWRSLKFVDRAVEERRIRQRMHTLFPTRAKEMVLGHGFHAHFVNRSTARKGNTEWELRVILQDYPREVTLRLLRHPRHPHWKERRLDPRYMGFAAAGVWNMPKPLLKAMGNPKRLIYRPRYPAPRRTLMGKGLAMRVIDFGRPIRLLDKSIKRCDSLVTSTTGRCGIVSIFFNKGTLLPGCYQVEVSYQDARGKTIQLYSRPVWANEFKQTSFWGSRSSLATHLNAKGRAGMAKRYETLKRVRWPYVHLLQLMPVYAERFALMMRRKKKESIIPYPLKTLLYDLDYKLNGGKAPPFDDFAAWQGYRQKVRRRGYRVAAPPYRPVVVPLPALAPGRHTVCFLGLRRNGSISPEPECSSVSIPELPQRR
ncbi:MAG: hypothetical protein JRH20_27065 [Deltaproteobacteria bacterium]|nr:hypothetical protein [Deltaproteobacteria bacterium]